jgi:pimeloyl-ACP methyl ester carboxylesterase
LQKLNLLGHSTGGFITGFYAAANPEKIKSILLVNSMPAKPEWSVNFTSKLDSVSSLIKKQNAKILYSSPLDTLKACWDYYALDGRGFYPTPQGVRRTWGDVCNSKMSNTLNPSKWHIYASMGNYDLTDKFTEVSARVLIIAGDDDVIPMASFEQWKNSFQNSTLIKVPGAAHFPHVDAPSAFFTAVELFLQGKTPDYSILDVSVAGVVLPGDKMGTAYQQARAAIIQVENELVKQVNKGDWESAASIYATDASIMAPGATPVTGRQAIASF